MAILSDRLFCDTPFFFASLVEDDVNFDRARQILEEAVEVNTLFLTTWDIISETVTLLRYRDGYDSAVEFLDEVVPSVHIVTYDVSVRQEAVRVFKKFSRDKKLSYCDCISYVIITTLLDHMPSLSFDEDFKRLGLTVIV
jgi:predicted nucleic acid-binding protein